MKLPYSDDNSGVAELLQAMPAQDQGNDTYEGRANPSIYLCKLYMFISFYCGTS